MCLYNKQGPEGREPFRAIAAFLIFRTLFAYLVKPDESTPGQTDPNAANVGGLQSPGVKSEVVVFYFEPLTTQNLEFSGVPEG